MSVLLFKMNDSLNQSKIASETNPERELAAILSRAVETKAEYDIRLLAQQLGTNYRSLMYWLRGDRPLPAHLLPRICTLLGNDDGLDFLESQAGRVAFKIPDPRISIEKELVAVSRLIKEVGEALESVAETLADGVVEGRELKTTIPKIDAVIQECASLRYLLEDLRRRGAKKERSNRANPR